MKVNVLLPVYNGADVLPATVESVLGQTHREFRFVIVDDGSVDRTSEALKAFSAADARVRVVSLTRNSGIITALNVGLQHLDDDCEYVARIDCGDLCHPERLARQAAFLDSDRDCAVIGSRFEMFSTDGPLSEGIQRFEQFSNSLCTHAEIASNFTVMSPLHHPTLMCRRQLFTELGGYSERYPAAEDYELIGRIITRGLQVAKLSEVLVRCRFTAGRGISQTKRLQQVKTALQIKLEFIEANYLRDDTRRRCVVWGHREFAGYLAEMLLAGTYPFLPIGFTDFESEAWGTDLVGLPVLPPEAIVASRAPGEIVITMWNRDRDGIVDYLTEHGWTRNRDFFVFS